MKKNNKHYKELRLKNKGQKPQVQTAEIDLDKDDEFYSTILKRFEGLKRYDRYRGKKKLTDKEKEQKECVEANLLEAFKESCTWCDYFEDCFKD